MEHGTDRPGRLLLIFSTAVLLVGACSTGEPPAGSAASPSAVPATSLPTALPSPTLPTVTFDPATLGVPGDAPHVIRNGETTADGVTTEDITFSRADFFATDAYLVHPARAGGAAAPAIVWFHWLESGSPTSNRTEFLDEARGLAKKGVVSLLVQGTFPWTDQPTSLEHDLAGVAADVRMLRAAVDLVAARDDVDPGRIALVGHDFGAMYASVVFGSDDRPAALVMLTPTARWGDWFLRYWAHGDSPEAYLSTMASLDPVTRLKGTNGRPVLLQFGGQDRYVPADVAQEISDAAGTSSESRTYDAGHELDAAARADRDAWLAARLGFG